MTDNHVTLPLFEDAFYTYPISLEGNSYILQFTFNERVQMYFFDLFTSDNVPIVLGEALVPNYPMFKDYALNDLSGFFWLEQKSELNVEPYKEFPDKLNEFYSFFYIYVT